MTEGLTPAAAARQCPPAAARKGGRRARVRVRTTRRQATRSSSPERSKGLARGHRPGRRARRRCAVVGRCPLVSKCLAHQHFLTARDSFFPRARRLRRRTPLYLPGLQGRRLLRACARCRRRPENCLYGPAPQPRQRAPRPRPPPSPGLTKTLSPQSHDPNTTRTTHARPLNAAPWPPPSKPRARPAVSPLTHSHSDPQRTRHASVARRAPRPRGTSFWPTTALAFGAGACDWRGAARPARVAAPRAPPRPRPSRGRGAA